MHPRIPIPRGWRRHTKAAILHILALSHYCFSAVLGAAQSYNRSIRLRAARLSA